MVSNFNLVDENLIILFYIFGEVLCERRMFYLLEKYFLVFLIIVIWGNFK